MTQWQPSSGSPSQNPATPQPQGTNASGGSAPAQSDGASVTVKVQTAVNFSSGINIGGGGTTGIVQNPA